MAIKVPQEDFSVIRKYKFSCSIVDSGGNQMIMPSQVQSFEMAEDIIVHYVPFQDEGLISKLQTHLEQKFILNLKLFKTSNLQVIEETEWDLFFVDYKFKLDYITDEPLIVSLHFNTYKD